MGRYDTYYFTRTFALGEKKSPSSGGHGDDRRPALWAAAAWRADTRRGMVWEAGLIVVGVVNAP